MGVVKLLKMFEATLDDLNRIDKLYKVCTLNLNERGLYQWDDRYPSISTYIKSISDKCQYIFEDDDILIGSVILNEIQSEEWNSITWNYIEGKILIIHALAINPTVQGQGYGQKVLELCEAHGIRNGYTAIRLDVFSENEAAIRLYEKNAYQSVGEVTFDFKPEGHQKYYCYDKVITSSKELSRNQF